MEHSEGRYALIRHLVLFFLLPIMGFATQATFDASTGLVVADVRINNRVTGRFGIDTGADRLYIDKSFAEKHYLAKDGIPDQRKVVGLNGATGGYFVSFRSIEVGDQRLNNVKATVIDFDELSGNRNVDHPDGLIGYDILSRMYVTVDYPANSFELEINRPRFLSGRTYETVSFRPIKHFIVVDVTFPDNRTRPMLLDYCATHTVISLEIAEQIQIDSKDGGSAFLDLEIDGTIRSSGVETIVRDMSLFRKSMSRVKIDGILGRTFLADHKITIDYRTSQIYLHQNAVAGK